MFVSASSLDATMALIYNLCKSWRLFLLRLISKEPRPRTLRFTISRTLGRIAKKENDQRIHEMKRQSSTYYLLTFNHKFRTATQ